MVSGNIKFISFLVVATIIVGCSTSNHKGVLGSKGRSSKSFAKRHQSREYQEAKVKDKKAELDLQDVKTTDPKVNASPASSPTVVTITKDVVTEQKVQQDVTAVAAQATNENTNERKPIEPVLVINHEIDPAFGINSITSTSPINSMLNNSAASAPYEPRLFTSGSGLNEEIKQAAKTQTNSTGTKISTKAAEQKESKHHWVLYFAFAQAFIALMLGLKQVFGMLDTPSDAGNKAISMSYATMGILSIHALLLIAVAKSFFS